MKELVGKEMYGFKFRKHSLHYSPSMDVYIGKIGTIEHQDDDMCQVRFKAGGIWSYPYPEILNHLVDKEDQRTIDEIIIELKKLTSKL